MKYIKKFNEAIRKGSSGMDTFKSTNKPSEENFQGIIDTLQSEIFDEYDISYLSDNEHDKFHNELDIEFKYWEWGYRTINIINISSVSEFNEIFTKLKELKDVIKGRTGYDIDIKTESWGEDYSTHRTHLKGKRIWNIIIYTK